MRRCWLCGRNGHADPLDKHHVFGGPFRGKSDRLGLWVWLCHYRCHIFGPQSAHKSGETARNLHRWGQEKAMQEQGWTKEDFIREFGKNYLED